MSIKTLSIEFGPDYVIGRIEFLNGNNATAVGVEAGDGMAWGMDAKEADEGSMARAVIDRAFGAVLDVLVGEQQQTEGGDAAAV